jgi:hypothetical protein
VIPGVLALAAVCCAVAIGGWGLGLGDKVTCYLHL